MGNRNSANSKVECQKREFVDPLSSDQKLSHLVYGFVRFHQDLNTNNIMTEYTPQVIIHICLNYIGPGTISIKSEAELQREQDEVRQLELKKLNEELLLNRSNNAINHFTVNPYSL